MEEKNTEHSSHEKNAMLKTLIKMIVIAIAVISIEIGVIRHFDSVGNNILVVLFSMLFIGTIGFFIKAIFYSSLLIIFVGLDK